MFAVLHSDINPLKSGLLHLTGKPYCRKGRSAKVKDGIINLILRNYLIDRYLVFQLVHLFENCDYEFFLRNLENSIQILEVGFHSGSVETKTGLITFSSCRQKDLIIISPFQPVAEQNILNSVIHIISSRSQLICKLYKLSYCQ
jgi:hypothetical protein